MRLLRCLAFAALCAIAPILVGAAEALSRSWPERDLVGRPIRLMADVIAPSVLAPALLLAFVVLATVSAVGTSRFAQGSVVRRTALIGSLSLPALGALWITVSWAHFNVVAHNHGAWGGILFPMWRLGVREFVVGLVFTAITLGAVLYEARVSAQGRAVASAAQPPLQATPLRINVLVALAEEWRDELVQVLEQAGFSVLLADSKEEALSMIQMQSPTAVVMISDWALESDKGRADGLMESLRGKVPTVSLISQRTWQDARYRWFDYLYHPPLHEYCSVPISREWLFPRLERTLKAAADMFGD